MSQGTGMQGSTAADLPLPLLIQILQQVPVKQRLSSCSLVCTSWAAAANSATTSIDTRVHPRNLRLFAKWLQIRGPLLQRLQLSTAVRTLSIDPPALRLRLPVQQLSQLTSLQLTGLAPSLLQPANNGSQQGHSSNKRNRKGSG